jgi:beta-phosphoglucomutase-like phosphatase (HAD superfamily)
LKEGIEPAPGAKMLLKKFRDARIKTAVASSSKNCAAILKSAGLSQLIDASTDGLDAERLELAGQTRSGPILGASRLGVWPSRIILFEYALAGVEAAEADLCDWHRSRWSEALLEHGAQVVIQDVNVEHD